MQRVETYVDSPVNITSAVHSHESGRKVAVIYVHPTHSAYPAIATKEGSYQNGERRYTEFRRGDILIREGTVNARVSLRTWPIALSRYQEMIKTEARKDIDQLIHSVVEALNGNGNGNSPVALALDMEDESFTSSVEAAIDTENTTALRRFTTAAGRVIRSTYKDPTDDARQTALDRLTEYIAVALENERDDLAQRGIEALYEAYMAPLKDKGADATRVSSNVVETARYWLDFMVRIYAIGALAVRLGRWNVLRPLVLQKVGDETFHYVSWLRHGVVEAARAELLSRKGDTGPRAGAVISLGLELCTKIPALRPDVYFDLEKHQILPSPVLDSLCEFDVLYCLIAASVSESQGFGYDFYPASVSFKQDRVDPILEHLVADTQMRDALFPEEPNSTLAMALTGVMTVAANESGRSHSFWRGLHGATQLFVEIHTP